MNSHTHSLEGGLSPLFSKRGKLLRNENALYHSKKGIEPAVLYWGPGILDTFFLSFLLSFLPPPLPLACPPSLPLFLSSLLSSSHLYFLSPFHKFLFIPGTRAATVNKTNTTPDLPEVIAQGWRQTLVFHLSYPSSTHIPHTWVAGIALGSNRLIFH